ncbi:hypothetical protein [Desulfopila aestuarii]|uniref:Uncharacterized protein n=1 Tax=Desulfopila aestuarii DSM 18488 TaxID=1121416 RepID=A0A1M7YB53_9BACT|nr:hypothetical protein [Desulfopila aestuarii]SHO49786.1 hypothetical protein SAMN02745220_03090 [Desulfopila aestuarii DSM 18488]
MTRPKSFIHLEFTEESSARLRGHQSVRTTFKLSERSINALSVLAGQLGIKQKSLFDHLVEDVQALKTIAREFETFPGDGQRVAKTYVISRKTLENLEKVSTKYNTPRDALVEFSIERILPLIEQEKEKYARRMKIARQLGELAVESRQLLQEAIEELGEDDHLVQELVSVARSTMAARQRVDAYLHKAKGIEDF